MTLNPDTTGPGLAVDVQNSLMRGQKSTGEGREWPSVLTKEGLTSGRHHYWEVEVGEKGYWAVGVSTNPRENIISEKPEGYWLVRLSEEETGAPGGENPRCCDTLGPGAGDQRRACPRKNRNEERQEQGTDGREEAGDVGGEREDEAAPPSQQQPESAETREPPNGMKPPTPQPRLKRLSHGLSQNEDNENDEAFVTVAKKN
ncbi:UNVERIFIED_CONTAM: hypothetical protein FKN15_022836 [Acipenser sinensis]